MSASSASADVLRLLAAVAQQPTQKHAAFATALGLPQPANLDEWRIAHTETFIRQCPAHASFIVGPEGQIGGEAADRVTDFRRMLGVSAQAEQADDLPGVLADYAELVAQAGDDLRAQHARAALLWEHLLSWVPLYLDSVERSAPSPYDRWAVVTRDVLSLEAAHVTVASDQLPLHLRAAPAAADLLEAESADQAIHLLLTPVQSGVVLTRADLARAAAALELDCGHNNRSAMIKYLLEQDAPGALAWLTRATRNQARARSDEHEQLGHVAQFWSDRADATVDALATMAARAGQQNMARCD